MLFFSDSLAPDADLVVLSGAEGRHAAVVRRLRPGERVDVGDGAGLVAECVVVGPAHGGGLELAVKAYRRVPRPDPAITVIQAIPKGDRGELAVEEMTEVGVDRIVPWQAERSVPIWYDTAGVPVGKGPAGKGPAGIGAAGEGPAGEGPAGKGPAGKGPARWRSTAREAAKQSLRAWIPEITAVASTQDAARIAAASTLAVLLDPGARLPLAGLRVPPSGDLVIVIGPEGGITDQEQAAFLAAGATARRLGPTILRTSTAAAVTAAVLLSHTPRWA